jgi:hemerythrin-like metal-binding protein
MEAHVTLLTWKHDCTVGVRAMDDQHGILMDAMNELRLAVVRGAGREQLSELLDQLIEFARMHFASEEQLMAQSCFPGLEQHRAAHQSMMAQALQQAHRLQYGERLNMSRLTDFLRSIFLEHIEGIDQQYGPWLNERGIR